MEVTQEETQQHQTEVAPQVDPAPQNETPVEQENPHTTTATPLQEGANKPHEEQKTATADSGKKSFINRGAQPAKPAGGAQQNVAPKEAKPPVIAGGIQERMNNLNKAINEKPAEKTVVAEPKGNLMDRVKAFEQNAKSQAPPKPTVEKPEQQPTGQSVQERIKMLQTQNAAPAGGDKPQVVAPTGSIAERMKAFEQNKQEQQAQPKAAGTVEVKESIQERMAKFQAATKESAVEKNRAEVQVAAGRVKEQAQRISENKFEEGRVMPVENKEKVAIVAGPSIEERTKALLTKPAEEETPKKEETEAEGVQRRPSIKARTEQLFAQRTSEKTPSEKPELEGVTSISDRMKAFEKKEGEGEQFEQQEETQPQQQFTQPPAEAHQENVAPAQPLEEVLNPQQQQENPAPADFVEQMLERPDLPRGNSHNKPLPEFVENPADQE